MKLKSIVSSLVLLGLASHAVAQAPAPAQRITITGSSIKRIAVEGALPLQVITRADITREGISSTEQLVMMLTSNGSGLDNLASNADVVDGAARGNNGATSANLRGQGSNATLILLNSRRVAAHGLNGGQVDLNQIPFSAIERIEVLKDGASAIYGTDAVGGVINFITRRNYNGLTAEAFVDVTEEGGGNIYRTSLTGGFGDIDTQGFNLLATLAYSENKALRGDQRDFTKTFQNHRGLSPDTRGTPTATIVPLAGTIIPNTAGAPLVPGTNVRADGGINPLNLPGGPGCESTEGMAQYAFDLWAQPSRRYACTWDTGRAAVIQQPVQNLNFLTRGTLMLGQHQLMGEFVASKVDTAKRFSNIQLLPSAGLTPLRFPRNAASAAVYDDIFNRLAAAFPSLEPQRGQPISYRWRCIECGPREIETTSETRRIFVGAEGPLFGWDYRAGFSQATSEVESTLGTGYHYRRDITLNGREFKGIVEALNSGVINPFLLPGQTQSQAARDRIAATSAAGVKLYGGKFTTTQYDASVSGPAFSLFGASALAAVGVDLRSEKYRFNGDERPSNERADIIGAPFDDGNALPGGVKRDIKAIYGELILPFSKTLEVTLAARRDKYDGFGTTTNPKLSFRFQPMEQLLFRGSYNEAFRVPTFNQIYNGAIVQQYLGSDIADPARCPGGRPIANDPNCVLVQNLVTVAGGTPDLGPETAEQFSYGVVWEPNPSFSISADWWRIKREDQIRVLGLRDLIENYSLFTGRFLRDGAGVLEGIDQRWINSGGSVTRGVDISARANTKALGATWSAGVDLSYLVEKISRLTPNAPWGNSEVARNTLSGDLGVRWKHNAWVSYKRGDWTGTLSQFYRDSYRDRSAPGVASGAIRPPEWKPLVDAYTIYNASVAYAGIKNLTLTAGVKNLLNTDPPFSYTYDDVTGAGGAWEPRVADPRGRSYTLKVEYQFF